MQISPIVAKSNGRDIVIDAGKMGYVYARDAASGHLLWQTKVGVPNGHDDDNRLAMAHQLHVPPTYTVEPGIVGGVEANMALADGVLYVPVANLASLWSAKSGLRKANFTAGQSEMLALDVDTGHVLWETKLSQMADGSATVSKDLVLTTTFDGDLVALRRLHGRRLDLHRRLCVLSHPGRRQGARYRQAQPRPAQAVSDRRAPPGHQRRRRDAGLRRAAQPGPERRRGQVRPSVATARGSS